MGVFLHVLEIHQKIAEALATESLNKLDSDGLPVGDCRGKTYDNAVVIWPVVDLEYKQGFWRKIPVKYSFDVQAAHVDPMMVASSAWRREYSHTFHHLHIAERS